MDGLKLLHAAQKAGLRVTTVQGDHMEVRGPKTATGIVQQLFARKAEITALIQAPVEELSGIADLSQNTHNPQKPGLGPRVLDAARARGMPRRKLPDGRICEGADRWEMFTSSPASSHADLVQVLLGLTGTDDPRDLPEQEVSDVLQVSAHDRALLLEEAERADFRSVEFRPGARTGGSREMWELFAARNSFTDIELARAAIRRSMS